jgi:hypothetical protein
MPDEITQTPPANDAPAQPEQPTNEADKPADGLPDWVRDPAKAYEEIQKLRKEAAASRKVATEREKAAADAEKTKLQEQGEFKKLYEEANAELQKLRDELKTSQVQALRQKVASELGIPPQLAERLKGDTEDEMRQDAETIKAAIPQQPASGTQNRQTTTPVPGGRATGETDAQRRERLYGSSSRAFAIGGVNTNKKGK